MTVYLLLILESIFMSLNILCPEMLVFGFSTFNIGGVCLITAITIIGIWVLMD